MTTTSDCLRFARLLNALRETGRTIPIGAAEALLLIAAGVDSVPELAVTMASDGRPVAPATISRLISLLRGRARWDRGAWVESPYGALIATRRHPHRNGYQLVLTVAGRFLIDDCLGGQYRGTTLPSTDLHTPTEGLP